MQVEFQVLRAGAVIFRKQYARGPDWKFGANVADALAEFHHQLPNIDLSDPDIDLKWTDVPPNE